MTKPSTPPHPPGHDEPEITQEESVPTDGADTEGEQMMKHVVNRKLQDPGSAEHKTPEKSGGAKPPEDTGKAGEGQP